MPANVSDLVVSLQMEAGEFSASARQAQQEMQNFAGKAEGAGKAGGNLNSTLQGIAREQRSQARTARFYTNELASIIPVSNEAKGSLENLAGVLVEGAAGGLGFGLAFEAAKFVIAGVTEEWTRHKRELEENIRLINDFRALQANLWRGVRDAIHPPTSGEKTVRSMMEEGEKAAAGLDAEIEDLKKNGLGFNLWQSILNVIGHTGPDEAEMKIRRLTEAASRMRKEARDAASAAKEVADEADRRAATNRVRMEGARLESEEAAAREKTRQAIEEISRDENLSAEEKKKLIRLQNEELEKQLRLADAIFRARGGEAYGKSEDANLLFQGPGWKMPAYRKDTSGEGSVADFYGLEAAGYDPAEIARKEEQRLKEMKETAKGYISATVDAAVMGFGDMITGAKSFKEYVEGVWQSILSTALAAMSRMLTEWIATQVAMKAVSAMGGGGGVVEAGGFGPVSMPEMVPMASPLSVAPGAGTEVNLYVSAMDARSFSELLDNPQHEAALAGKVADLTRLGRGGLNG